MCAHLLILKFIPDFGEKLYRKFVVIFLFPNLVTHNVAPVPTEDCPEPPHAGGAEEWGDLQWAFGQL